MANVDHLVAFQKGIEFWNTWRKNNPDINPNLSGITLENLNLDNVDLSNTNMRRTKFQQVIFGKCNLSGADLRESMCGGADLTGITGFLEPQQFAGADLTGTKLPENLADLFDDLEVAKGISGKAQKLFIAMLGACLYCLLTIASTTDLNLITNRSSSALPIIQTSTPIVGFYFVGPLLLLSFYFYFHAYLQKL
jgi:uncharacterized protein YjbI with pentapeptide repeats